MDPYICSQCLKILGMINIKIQGSGGRGRNVIVAPSPHRNLQPYLQFASKNKQLGNSTAKC